MDEAPAEYGTCPGCGAARVSTGAPIWEVYCPVEACTYDAEEFARFFRIGEQRRAKERRIREAAPDMLAALHLVGMSAGWQYLTMETRAIIEAAIAKAEGK